MKKTILISLVTLAGMTLQSFGQKLDENKTDEFTKNSVKRTSWETLSSSSVANAHFRISLINEYETFDVKLMINKVFSIDKDQELMFKLANGDVVKLQNLKYTITCNGCGATGLAGSEAEGIQVVYPLAKEQIEQLKANKIVKVRIYTNDGYVEDDVKDKNAEKIIKSLQLL
jgi:hypothetical protein